MNLFSLVLLAWLLPATLASNNLRHDRVPAPEEVYDNLTPKAAPAEFPPRTYSSLHHRRRLNAATVNAAVAASLPTINELMQSQIPEPIPIDETTVQTFSDSGTCSGNTADCSYATAEVTGASSTEITSMEVVDDGTFSFNCGCPTSFSGTFNFLTSAPAGYNLVGTTVLSAATCNQYTSTFTGSVNQPEFFGSITLAGTISGNSASFSEYRLNSIDVRCASTSVTFATSLGSSDFANSETSVTQSIGSDFKNTVKAKVLDAVKLGIEFAFANTFAPGSIDLGIGGGIPIILSFYRDAAQQQAADLQSEAQAMVQGWQNRAQGFIGKFGFVVEGPPSRRLDNAADLDEEEDNESPAHHLASL